jgi:chromosome segregation ATPase
MKKVVLLLAVMVLCSWSFGVKHGGAISKGKGGGVSGPGANQTASPDGHGQVAATPKADDANKDAAPAQDTPTTAPSFVASQSDIQKANAQLTAVTAKLRATFEQSQDFKDTAAEQQQAHADYEAAQKTIADSLANNPQYASAVEERKSAEAKLAAARTEAPENVPQFATEVMHARGAVKDMEKTLGAKNDSLVQAKTKADAADEKVTKLRSAFEASMKSDPDYVAAKSALDAARGIKTASAK